jgi:uncharacterized membrane protein
MKSEVIEIEYLKKSAKIFKIYFGLFLFSILMTVLVKPILRDLNPDLFDLLVGLPILLFFVLAPVGLFYSWKSYKRKEGSSSTRLKYFIGHLFFCLLIVGFIVVIISDIKKVL